MQLGRSTGQVLSAAWRQTGSALGSAMTQTLFSTAAEAPSMGHLAWSLRALRTAGTGIAITAVVLPAGALAALVLSGGREADVWEMAQAVPRTARVVWWSLWAAYNYKALAASFATATISEGEYRNGLEEMHRLAAARLLRVCQTNGGVYVKAGQLAVSMQAVPAEYREVSEDRSPLTEIGAIPNVSLGVT